MSRLRRSRPQGAPPAPAGGCRHCNRPLQACPRGRSCPGSNPLSPSSCTDCSWGVICLLHGRGWTAAAVTPTTRPAPPSAQCR